MKKKKRSEWMKTEKEKRLGGVCLAPCLSKGWSMSLAWWSDESIWLKEKGCYPCAWMRASCPREVCVSLWGLVWFGFGTASSSLNRFSICRLFEALQWGWRVRCVLGVCLFGTLGVSCRGHFQDLFHTWLWRGSFFIRLGRIIAIGKRKNLWGWIGGFHLWPKTGSHSIKGKGFCLSPYVNAFYKKRNPLKKEKEILWKRKRNPLKKGKEILWKKKKKLFEKRKRNSLKKEKEIIWKKGKRNPFEKGKRNPLKKEKKSFEKEKEILWKRKRNPLKKKRNPFEKEKVILLKKKKKSFENPP